MDRMNRIKNSVLGFKSYILSILSIPVNDFFVTGRLLLQLDDGGAGAALILGGELEACDVRVVAEQFGDGAAQGAGAVAVDDADVRVALQEGFVEEAVYLVARVVGGLADKVKFGVNRVARAFKLDLGAALRHAAEAAGERVVLLRLLRLRLDEFEVRDLLAEAKVVNSHLGLAVADALDRAGHAERDKAHLVA